MFVLAIAVSSFVLSHLLLSHPLRAPIVGRIGEKGFMGVYSIVAIATLVWAVRAYGDAPTLQLWTAPSWFVHLGHLVMLFASILLGGSLLAPNPALNMMGGVLRKSTEPKGVMRITRHPMMWAIGLWGIVHVVASGRLETLVLAGGIAVLALAGARLQDGKKRAQLGEAWAAYASRTSYLPFVTGHVWPGYLPIIAGTILFAVLVWAHPLVIGKSTGIV